MTVYSYKARNDNGELISGNLTVDSEQEAITQLRQMKYTPIKISEENLSKAADVSSILAFKLPEIGTPRVKTRDLMVFCTNLSSMINAGIPLLNALTISVEQSANTHLVNTVRKVTQMVSDGSSFSEALALFPKVFSNFFVNMIRAAEMSGTLDQVLREMAVYLERQDTLKQTVRGMMVYPIVLLTASFGVILLIITFIMPQFVQIFTKANVPLPAPTKMLYETGLWIRTYPLYYIPTLIALFFGIKAFFKTATGKIFWDHLILKMPLAGPLMNKSFVARFCRTLATMITTGVPMLQSFRIVQQVLGNTVFVRILDEIYDSVEKGEGISTVLIKRKEFPKDVSYMISVGEKTGNIGMMLNKIADFYETKVQFEVKELMVLIEPTFIAIMGACVGGILASVILPMFDMVKTIQR